MDWKGVWINQYRSKVEITDAADHRIVGSCRTALDDGGFHGQDIPVFGSHQGDASVSPAPADASGRCDRRLHGAAPRRQDRDDVAVWPPTQ